MVFKITCVRFWSQAADVLLKFILSVLQGGLHEKLDNSTIFGTAIAGLLSGAGCIHYIERTRGLPQGKCSQL